MRTAGLAGQFEAGNEAGAELGQVADNKPGACRAPVSAYRPQRRTRNLPLRVSALACVPTGPQAQTVL